MTASLLSLTYFFFRHSKAEKCFTMLTYLTKRGMNINNRRNTIQNHLDQFKETALINLEHYI